jgi:hypothetical protein
MEDVLYQHQFLAELQRLIAKVGDKEVYVRYTFPGGLLVVTGFQPGITERTIIILLQRDQSTGLGNGALQLVLPAEETAVYRRFEDEHGELFVSVAYPYCDLRPLEDAQIAVIELATVDGLVDPAVNSPTLQ